MVDTRFSETQIIIVTDFMLKSKYNLHIITRVTFADFHIIRCVTNPFRHNALACQLYSIIKIIIFIIKNSGQIIIAHPLRCNGYSPQSVVRGENPQKRRKGIRGHDTLGL